jgi:hypothetical protein
MCFRLEFSVSELHDCPRLTTASSTGYTCNKLAEAVFERERTTEFFQLLDIGVDAVPRCGLHIDNWNAGDIDICSF